MSYLLCQILIAQTNGVEPSQHPLHISVILEERKLKYQGVNDADTKHNSPNDRMGSNKGPVWESHGTNDKKQATDCFKPEVNITVGGPIVSKMYGESMSSPKAGILQVECMVYEIRGEQNKHRDRMRFVQYFQRDIVDYPLIYVPEVSPLCIGLQTPSMSRRTKWNIRTKMLHSTIPRNGLRRLYVEYFLVAFITVRYTLDINDQASLYKINKSNK